MGKAQVDSVMDAAVPGHGQIRTRVRFDPKIFGIERWPYTECTGIVLDIYVYPKTKIEEPKLEAFLITGSDVEKLLGSITSGNKQLTSEELEDWSELIMCVVMNMRAGYENPDVPEDHPVRVYYKPHWREIEAARNNEELAQALNNLREAVHLRGD